MKPTGATKEATVSEQAKEVIQGCSNWSDIQYRILPRVEKLINERERLREALRAALNSLSRTVRKSYPNYPEEQMQISETMTVANARTILNDATPSTSAGGG